MSSELLTNNQNIINNHHYHHHHHQQQQQHLLLSTKISPSPPPITSIQSIPLKPIRMNLPPPPPHLITTSLSLPNGQSINNNNNNHSSSIETTISSMSSLSMINNNNNNHNHLRHRAHSPIESTTKKDHHHHHHPNHITIKSSSISTIDNNNNSKLSTNHQQQQQQPIIIITKNDNNNKIGVKYPEQQNNQQQQQMTVNQNQNHQRQRSSPIIIHSNKKIHSLIKQFDCNLNASAKETTTLSMTTTTTTTTETSSPLPLTKPSLRHMFLSHNNDNDNRQKMNGNQRHSTEDFLPEGNVDDDDDLHQENDGDELDHEEDEDDDDIEGEEIAYEIDADDEQSNDMLDDNTDYDDRDDEDDGPKSTSPGPVAPRSSVTKIDPSTKSMIKVVSIMKNHSNSNHQNQSPKTITSFINEKMKELPPSSTTTAQQQESEDSAADVSYERTTSDLAESDLEDTTTLTTVDTTNAITNLDNIKELSYDQRFKMTQTIWYLPHINRATVVHYLQRKAVGVFIVRQSSKPNTMAVSVRLPQGRGPHVEHYLIEKIFKQQPVQSNQSKSTTSVFRLEGSEHYFSTILQLVLHYSKCQDELPVQLTLPSVLLNSNRSHLTSLALLGQEFWQSKFVSLKQLPKNSLNNETLAMINQNQNQKSEESQQKQQQSTTKQYNRQQAQRNNSNSSESNQSNKSSSMSMSPKPPSFDVRSRRNTSDSASPPTTTNNSQNIITLSTPPPLPPKNPSMICDPQNVVTAKIITENDSNHPILLSSSPTIPTTLVEVHNNPSIKNNQQQQISSRLLSSSNRLPNAYVPPPIPPRNNRNSPNGSTPPPPQKPPLPSNGPPLSSLRSKKPHSNQQQQQQKVSILNELLSPMSMTESEIEMAKFSLQRKIAPNILEVDEYDDDDISNEKSLINRNYYNQMINQATSSPIIIEDDEIKNQKTPSPAPAHAIASFPSHHSEQLLHSLPCDVQQSVKCDVCTQTYDTNKNLQPQQNGRITRANSSLSCFYMDPIDALVAINQQQQQPKRHSDPELASKNSQNTMDTLETNQQQQSTFTMSHSLESLLENFRHRFATAASGSELYSIRETILNERRNQFIQQQQQQQQQTNVPKHDTGFSTVDSAWQWHSVVGQNDHNNVGGIINRSAAAQLEHLKRSSITTNGSMKSDITTVEDLISAKAPELAVPKITHIDSINMIHKQLVQQDQQCCNNNDRERKLTAKSIATDVCTEFSEPWNRDIVESLFISELHQGDIHQQSNHQIDDDDDNNSTRQLLNNDLINFNSFLLNQEQHLHGGLLSQTNEDDYDSVAEDEIIDDSLTTNNHQGQFFKRDDSQITLKDKNQHSSTTDDGIKLNIAFNISNYVFELASRKDNTFAKSIDNFIECTKETTDPNPSVILGYVRQFMNGMKNYLIKHGEGDFINVVQNERSRLKPNQFLNIDSILEVSLQKLIIKPLKNFLYELFIRSHTMSGSLKILSTNIKLAQNKSPEELGIRPELLPIEPRIMAEIQKNLRRLQQSYSPIKKLEHLLKCIAILNGNFKEKLSKFDGDNNKQQKTKQSKSNRAFNGDDLLPMLVYLIVHCGVISAEIESEYMLGLLHPSILNGEGSYYLTVLSSAIQVLKTMYTADNARSLEDIITLNGNNTNGQSSLFSMLRSQPSENLQRQMISSNKIMNGKSLATTIVTSNPLALPSIANMQAYMKIMIPNELTSIITCKTVPVRHNMTTKEVCRMIAHTFRITNPEDYSLYRIKENGLEEIQLLDNEYPQVIKSELMARNESTMFAYKRCDAKFIWPITSPN